MRIVNRAVFVVVATFLVLFAVSNRETVSVALWPLPFVADASLYLVCFLALLVGFLIGASAAWNASRNTRRELRSRRRRIEALERELAATQAQLENHSAQPRTALPVERQSI